MRYWSTFLIILGLVFIQAGPIHSTTSSQTIPVLNLDDVTINPIVSEFIDEEIKEAEANKAPCLIVKLDTPGGFWLPREP